MSSIMHIYKLEGETSDEFVNENFKQRFLHVHQDGITYLIRMMDYAGKKLDPVKDSDEIVELMEDYDENCPEEIKKDFSKFLNNLEIKK